MSLCRACRDRPPPQSSPSPGLVDRLPPGLKYHQKFNMMYFLYPWQLDLNPDMPVPTCQCRWSRAFV